MQRRNAFCRDGALKRSRAEAVIPMRRKRRPFILIARGFFEVCHKRRVRCFDGVLRHMRFHARGQTPRLRQKLFMRSGVW